MGSIRDKWREFLEWQRRPHQVAPMSEEHHRCHTCGQEFQGNYCPRCGQSAMIGRYSFKKALLLFLDVWGLGNRGMFRTLRDLILRPGYMIRDYLSGMQMAYFPPFKLLFLLTALALVVESGFNLKGQNYFELQREEVKKSTTVYMDLGEGTELPADQQQYNEQVEKYALVFLEYQQKFPNVTTLCLLLFLSGYLYYFFRRCPNIPDLRYSELMVALVYSVNFQSIFQILTELLCLGMGVQYVLQLLPIIPLKQMSGYSWLRCIWYVALSFLMLMVMIVIISVALMIVKKVL